MMKVNKTERIKAALKSQEVDRTPVNAWWHISAADQDSRELAECLVYDNEKYDFDFIKLMPFGLYGVQDWGVKVKIFCQKGKPPVALDNAIHAAEDWGRLEVLSPVHGTFGKTLQIARNVEKLVGGKVPFVQTIFSPLSLAHKLAGDRILLDIKENPALFKQALSVITETLIGFVKANIEAGVSGFFFATRCSNYHFMTVEEYEEFGVPYDLKVIDTYKDKTFFNIVHLHGQNCMFDLIEKYPVHCLNWHDRSTPPSLAEARAGTGKCLLGGLQELPLVEEDGTTHPSLLNSGSVEEVEKLVHDAIRQVNGKGLIIGPGCGTDQFVPEQNIFAVRRAVGSYIGSP
jgi:uroporphyrinogen decarboxylase